MTITLMKQTRANALVSGANQTLYQRGINMTLYQNYMKCIKTLNSINKRMAVMIGKLGWEDEVSHLARPFIRYERHARKIEKFVVSLALSQADIDERRAMQECFKSSPTALRRTVVRLMEKHKDLFDKITYNVCA